MDEFPFKRIRRRKKANRGTACPFSLVNFSTVWRAGVDGKRLAIRLRKLIVIVAPGDIISDTPQDNDWRSKKTRVV